MATQQFKKWHIGEWFGNSYTALSNEERLRLAAIGKQKFDEANQLCPFRTNVHSLDTACNKKGGLCSMRQYWKDDENIRQSEQLVAMCPSRLGGKESLKRVARTILGTEEVWLVKEVPFLFNIVAEGETPKNAGRIDWILVDKNNMANWCAVETQSVYFSGPNMPLEFDNLIATEGGLGLPVENRRPDYRSSVPKRLSPQLELKSSVLSNWGKKVAVIVDEFVHSCMGPLAETPFRSTGDAARDRRNQLTNSQVIWFIVKIDDQQEPAVVKEFFTSLQASLAALGASNPAEHEDFIENLEKIVQDPKKRNKKVFSVS